MDILKQFNGDGDVSVRLKQAHAAKSLPKSIDLAFFIYLFFDVPALILDRLSFN